MREVANVADAKSSQGQRRNLKKIAHGNSPGSTSGPSKKLLDFGPLWCTHIQCFVLVCVRVYILQPNTPMQHLIISSSKKVLQKNGESSVYSTSASTTIAVAHAHNLRLHGSGRARLRPLPAPTGGRPRDTSPCRGRSLRMFAPATDWEVPRGLTSTRDRGPRVNVAGRPTTCCMSPRSRQA